MSLISEYVKDLRRFIQKQFAVSFIIGEKSQKGDWLKLLFWINSQEICLELPYKRLYRSQRAICSDWGLLLTKKQIDQQC